jgi:hypothetical protein
MVQLRTLTGAAVAVAAVSAFVGCSLPPVTTSEQQFAVKYNMIVPSATNGVPIPLVPGFSDQKPPATTFPVPKEAKSVKLSSVNLNLKMQNTGPLPLKIKIYLSPANVDPYTQAPLGGDAPEIDLPAASPEVSKVFSIDPALLTQENLKLGYSFSSAGSQQAVTFKDTDQVNVKYSVAAAVKLF